MATSTSPCYVFRLIKFDAQGNKVQKRKYGFTARNGDENQLDENVFSGIITRAEQTFHLKPQSYSLYLVLGGGPYVHELGETSLHLDDYPILSSHSWTALHTFSQFQHHRRLIAGLTPDAKGRKVVNFCLVMGTLHNVKTAREMKLQFDRLEAKKAEAPKRNESDNDNDDDTANVATVVEREASAIGQQVNVPATTENQANKNKKLPALVQTSPDSLGALLERVMNAVGQPGVAEAWDTLGLIDKDGKPNMDSIKKKEAKEVLESIVYMVTKSSNRGTGGSSGSNKTEENAEVKEADAAVKSKSNSFDVEEINNKYRGLFGGDRSASASPAPSSSVSSAAAAAAERKGEERSVEELIMEAEAEAQAEVANAADPPVPELPTLTAQSSIKREKASPSPSRSNDLQNISELVNKFSNFIAPPPTAGALPSATAALEGLAQHGIAGDLFRRAAEFIAPPPAATMQAGNANTDSKIPRVPIRREDNPGRGSWTRSIDPATNAPCYISPTGTKMNIDEALKAMQADQWNLQRQLQRRPFDSLTAPDSVAKARATLQGLATEIARAKGMQTRRQTQAALHARRVRGAHHGSQPDDPQFNFVSQSPCYRGWGAPIGKIPPPASIPATTTKDTSTAPAPAAASGAAAEPAKVETDKYASLKASFDKFVLDFNANLADAFGGPVPEVPSANTKIAEGESILEATGQKTPSYFSSKSSSSPVHKQTCSSARNEADNEKDQKKHAVHNATCDICEAWIIGTRYKCFTCPDWDCCEKCFSSIDQHHPGHTMAALHEPSDLIRRKTNPAEGLTARHFAIHCDGCNKPITGIRYKCTHSSCPDFDLCSACEADPTSYLTDRKIGAHSYRDHVLVKIRQPIASAGFSSWGTATGSQNVRMARANLEKAIKNIRNALPVALAATEEFKAYYGGGTNEKKENKTTANVSTSTTIPGTFTTTPAASASEVESAPASFKPAAFPPFWRRENNNWVVDVPVPYAMLDGKSEKDIKLSFDLGKNEKGETVILGLADDGNNKSFIHSLNQQEQQQAEVKAEEAEDMPVVDKGKGKETTVSFEEEIDALAVTDEAQQQIQDEDEEIDNPKQELDARWVNDLTFHDGSIVAAGTVFNKIWRVQNTGKSAWPSGSKLICVSGFGKEDAYSSTGQREVAYKVRSATSGEIVDITAENIIAPEMKGKFMSYYRFVAPDGSRFGDRLWTDIVVEENEGLLSNSKTSSNDSLNASSVIAPSIPLRGSMTTPSAQGTSRESVITSFSSAVTSPRTATSDLADVDSFSFDGDSSDDEGPCDFVILTEDEEDYADIVSVGTGSNRR